MKSAALTIVFLTLVFYADTYAQKKATPPSRSKPAAAKSSEIGQTAIVIDETLSVLRKSPSLFAESVHRMSRGRKVQIQAVQEADGIKFFKVAVPPANFGWVQADAVFGKFRPGDEERLARMVQSYDGFDQVEIASLFFEMYPNSKLRSALLLLYGDVLERIAVDLSRSANSRLSKREMAASAAPLHSYYLNFNMLDRYRKLGVMFQVNPTTKLYHYEGWSWREIIAKYPGTPEAEEAQKRLDSLKQKVEKK